jgi:hypothetical protein
MPEGVEFSFLENLSTPSHPFTFVECIVSFVNDVGKFVLKLAESLFWKVMTLHFPSRPPVLSIFSRTTREDV